MFRVRSGTLSEALSPCAESSLDLTGARNLTRQFDVIDLTMRAVSRSVASLANPGDVCSPNIAANRRSSARSKKLPGRFCHHGAELTVRPRQQHGHIFSLRSERSYPAARGPALQHVEIGHRGDAVIHQRDLLRGDQPAIPFPPEEMAIMAEEDMGPVRARIMMMRGEG
jgi:hypothetical protein